MDRHVWTLADWQNTPWCVVTPVPGGHTFVYHEARWPNGMSYSGLLVDDFPDQVARRANLYGAEPTVVERRHSARADDTLSPVDLPHPSPESD